MEAAALSYRHPRTGEWAHDVRDPLGEARRVYAEPSLAARPPRAGECLRLLDIGFGRGLNTACALAAAATARPGGRIRALGLEPHPERLTPWPPLPVAIAAVAPWWGLEPGAWSLGAAVCGEVRAAPAPEGLAEDAAFDWIFLDLHSPGRHPEDWRPDLLAAVTAAAAPGAVLTSYCVARALRDGLADLGWRVARERPAAGRDRLLAVLAIPGQPVLDEA
ncbi:MAG TPA: MnmC family methyltransferase [Planctomycetota bacterium]